MQITRRDFVNGVLVGVGASLIGCPVSARAQDLTEAWTGYSGTGDYARSNGNTAEVVNAAHGVRDGRYESGIAKAPVVDGLFDLIVVGGGFAGLAAAYEFKKARPNGTVLLLENHRIPGGEAKQNEIDVDGIRLIGPQGSNGTLVPGPEYGLAHEYWYELGLPTKFEYVAPQGRARSIRFSRDNYDPMFWQDASADVGWFFDGTTVGTRRGWVKNIFADKLARAPIDENMRRDWLSWKFNERTFVPPAGSDEDRWLDSMSYAQYVTNVMGLGPSVSLLADPILAVGDYGVSSDAVSAYAAKLLALPGASGALQKVYANREVFSFPGGNAAIARYIVRALIPESISGKPDFFDIVDAPFVFDAFDRPNTRVRIRLGATAIAVRHDASTPDRATRVDVVYAREGRLEKVSTKAVVMATGGWITKHVVRDLPTEYRSAYDSFHHAPVLVINVALRNWRPMADLGISAARWFGGFGFFANIRQPMIVDSYRSPLDPDKPAMLTFYVGFPATGLPLTEQTAAGRRKLFNTSYGQFEQLLRSQMRMLFSAYGFDDRRDIAGIVLNRWGHAYIAPQPGWYFGLNGAPAPREVPRRRFGRISFGHSELTGRQNWPHAIEEGKRATIQALEVLS